MMDPGEYCAVITLRVPFGPGSYVTASYTEAITVREGYTRVQVTMEHIQMILERIREARPGLFFGDVTPAVLFLSIEPN